MAGTVTAVTTSPSVPGAGARMRKVVFTVAATTAGGAADATTIESFTGLLMGVDYQVDGSTPMDTGVTITLKNAAGVDLLGNNGAVAGLGTANTQVCPVGKDRSGSTFRPFPAPLFNTTLQLNVAAGGNAKLGVFIAYILTR